MVVGSTFSFRGVSCMQATRENLVVRKKAKLQGRVVFGANFFFSEG